MHARPNRIQLDRRQSFAKPLSATLSSEFTTLSEFLRTMRHLEPRGELPPSAASRRMIFTDGDNFGISSPIREPHRSARFGVCRVCFDRHADGHHRANLAGLHFTMVAG